MSNTENNNLEFWESVSKTNPKYTKPVTFGRKFTAIDAHYQIMSATEKWGMFGKGWGILAESETIATVGEFPNTILIYKATLFYPEGKFSICSSIAITPLASNKPKLDDDCVKKVATDALTKGLSKLGFNADVFLGKFDDNKYVQQMSAEFTKPVVLTNKEMKDKVEQWINTWSPSENKTKVETWLAGAKPPDIKKYYEDKKQRIESV